MSKGKNIRAFDNIDLPRTHFLMNQARIMIVLGDTENAEGCGKYADKMRETKYVDIHIVYPSRILSSTFYFSIEQKNQFVFTAFMYT